MQPQTKKENVQFVALLKMNQTPLLQKENIFNLIAKNVTLKNHQKELDNLKEIAFNTKEENVKIVDTTNVVELLIFITKTPHKKILQ